LSAPQLVNEDIQYLVADYLAEITMVILARARMANPDAGHVDEFVSHVWRPLMKKILAKGIKIVTNAGGLFLLLLGFAVCASLLTSARGA
jgi:hypothetical protein